MTVVSRWIFDEAFALPPQSGLAWPCFLFPLIGRVEDWRADIRLRWCSSAFALALSPAAIVTFPAPASSNGAAVFPHSALLRASRQGL